MIPEFRLYFGGVISARQAAVLPWGKRAGPYPYERAIALVWITIPGFDWLMCDLLAQASYRVAEASKGFPRCGSPSSNP